MAAAARGVRVERTGDPAPIRHHVRPEAMTTADATTVPSRPAAPSCWGQGGPPARLRRHADHRRRACGASPPTAPSACAVLRRAVELGVDLIDTADSYGPEVSEDLIREALHPYPDDLVIATKAGLTRQGPGRWLPVGRPEYLRQQCEMSLRRLGRRADRPVPAPPDRRQGAGRRAVRPPGRPGRRGQGGCRRPLPGERGRARGGPGGGPGGQRPEPLQPDRPLLGGRPRRLRGRRARPSSPGSRSPRARWPAPAARWTPSSAETGATPSQVALAWLLHRSPVMLPIPGTSSVAHVEENCGAAALELTDDQVPALTDAG